MSEQYLKTLNPYSRMALVVRGWGLEGAIALALFVAWELAVALDGEGLGILVLGLLGIVVWRHAGLRSRLATTLRTRATRRWFSRVLVACEVISRRGQIPRVEGSEPIPAGQRRRLRMVAGLSAEVVVRPGSPRDGSPSSRFSWRQILGADGAPDEGQAS